MSEFRTPPEHEHPVTRVITAAFAQPDIKPYKAMAGDSAGKLIDGRREHREFLKRNRLIEVGDEPIKDTSKMRSTVRKGEVAEALKQAIAQHCVPDFKRGGLRERVS